MKTKTWEYRIKKAVRWNTEEAASDVIQFINDEFLAGWINPSNQMPEIGQECWAVDKNKKLYLVSVRKALLSNKIVFFNMIGRGWDVHDIVKWQPVVFPKI